MCKMNKTTILIPTYIIVWPAHQKVHQKACRTSHTIKASLFSSFGSQKPVISRQHIQKKRCRIFFLTNILHLNCGNCCFFFPVGSLNRVRLKVVSLFCWWTGYSGIFLTCSLWPLRAWAFLLTPTEIEHPSNICRAHLHSAWHAELPLTAISLQPGIDGAC